MSNVVCYLPAVSQRKLCAVEADSLLSCRLLENINRYAARFVRNLILYFEIYIYIQVRFSLRHILHEISEEN